MIKLLMILLKRCAQGLFNQEVNAIVDKIEYRLDEHDAMLKTNNFK